MTPLLTNMENTEVQRCTTLLFVQHTIADSSRRPKTTTTCLRQGEDEGRRKGGGGSHFPPLTARETGNLLLISYYNPPPQREQHSHRQRMGHRQTNKQINTQPPNTTTEKRPPHRHCDKPFPHDETKAQRIPNQPIPHHHQQRTQHTNHGHHTLIGTIKEARGTLAPPQRPNGPYYC